MQQLIKWTGSKRSQCIEISKNILSEYETYFEPFCGSCALGFYLLKTKSMQFKKFIFSDINNDLINTYNTIKENPQSIIDDYRKYWNELNKDDNIKRKQEYYKVMRECLNTSHEPSVFFFIMRVVQNGMPRYNQKGEFNSSFHITRPGANPNLICKIVNEYYNLLNNHNVVFKHCNYFEHPYSENDLVYLDPPYFNTHGIYYGKIDYDKFISFLKSLKSDFLLSFDGISTKDNTVEIPKIYNEHKYIYSGKSPFNKINNQKDVKVFESLYIKTKSNTNSEDW